MRGRKKLMRGIMISCLAGPLMVAAARVGAAPPRPPPTWEAAPSVAISFVTDTIGTESGQRIASRVATQLRTALTDAHYQVVEDPQAADEHLRVSILLTDAVARDYQVEISIESEGLPRKRSTVLEPTICHACTEARVVEFVMAERSEIVAELDARTQEPESAPSPRVDLEPVGSTAPPPPRRLAHAGLATLSLGVIALAAGASLWGVGEYAERPDPSASQSEFYDLRPAGIALTAIGALATVTGVSLFAVDVSRRSSNKLSLRTTPGYAGLHFQARF